jgi:hypothetical protein
VQTLYVQGPWFESTRAPLGEGRGGAIFLCGVGSQHRAERLCTSRPTFLDFGIPDLGIWILVRGYVGVGVFAGGDKETKEVRIGREGLVYCEVCMGLVDHFQIYLCQEFKL